MKAILGLGGNIGDSLGNLRAAVNAISNLCGTRLLRVSRYYLSEAVEVTSTPEVLQSAWIMFATLPIICIYPFLQKYFVKGVMIGAVKG